MSLSDSMGTAYLDYGAELQVNYELRYTKIWLAIALFVLHIESKDKPNFQRSFFFFSLSYFCIWHTTRWVWGLRIIQHIHPSLHANNQTNSCKRPFISSQTRTLSSPYSLPLPLNYHHSTIPQHTEMFLWNHLVSLYILLVDAAIQNAIFWAFTNVPVPYLP